MLHHSPQQYNQANVWLDLSDQAFNHLALLQAIKERGLKGLEGLDQKHDCRKLQKSQHFRTSFLSFVDIIPA